METLARSYVVLIVVYPQNILQVTSRGSRTITGLVNRTTRQEGEVTLKVTCQPNPEQTLLYNHLSPNAFENSYVV
jgi:hypothetical protein